MSPNCRCPLPASNLAIFPLPSSLSYSLSLFIIVIITITARLLLLSFVNVSFIESLKFLGEYFNYLMRQSTKSARQENLTNYPQNAADKRSQPQLQEQQQQQQLPTALTATTTATTNKEQLTTNNNDNNNNADTDATAKDP